MAATNALLARLRALSSVGTTVTSPQEAAPARACACCSSRFEDPALLRQAAEAAAGLDTAMLRAACAASPAVRSEALRLAAELPAALRLNMEPFMQDRPTIDHCDLPLPEALFFTFLQAEYDLCVALFPLLSAEGRHRVLRALVPLVRGTLEASGAGYGRFYLLRVGKIQYGDSATWERIGGNYGPFFFAAEVEDEGVLDLIRQHDLQDFFEDWAFLDRERGDQSAGLATKRAYTCCSGRFEDPALLQQAADAIAGLDVGKLRAACTRSPAVRSEALRLAAELLPAALRLNMDIFMQQADAVDLEDLPLPQELFFKFLQLEYDLCEALTGQLDLIRQLGVQVCFEVWAEAARESWATEPDQLADKWLGRL